MVGKRAFNVVMNSLMVTQINLINRIGQVILILGFDYNWLLIERRVKRKWEMRPIGVSLFVGLHRW